MKIWKRNIMEERSKSMYERVNGMEKRGRRSCFNSRRRSKEGTEREAAKEQKIKGMGCKVEEIKEVDKEQRNVRRHFSHHLRWAIDQLNNKVFNP
jgi:hypothetical protein